MHFRYDVQSKARINALEPRELGQDQSRILMRATMLGNSMAGNLKKLSGMDSLRILWEVGLPETVLSIGVFVPLISLVLAGETEPSSSSCDTAEAEDVVDRCCANPRQECCSAWMILNAVRVFVFGCFA